MGYSTIIYITGSVMLFGIMSMNINTVVGDQLTQAVSYYEEVQVRNLCNSVTEMLASSVSSDVNFRSSSYTKLSVSGGSAYYRVIDTVVVSDSLVKIEVIGYFGKTPKVTTSYFIVEEGGVDLPEHMKYAASSTGNISLSGNSKIVDDGNPSLNADVYVKSMSLSGSSNVEGFVKYTSSFTGSTAKVVPNSNPSGLPSTEKVSSSINIPSFNASDHLAKATVKYYSNVTIKNSTLTLGTKNKPAIVYISGNLYLQANSKVNGYGIIIVTGNVEMSGNTTFGTKDPNTSSLGIYANGNISGSGNNSYYGQMFANGNIELSGNADIHGNVSAKGNISLSGNNTIAYKPAAVELTQQIWAVSGGGASTQRATQRLYYE